MVKIYQEQRAKWLPRLQWLATERAAGGFQRSDAMALLRCTGYQAKYALLMAVDDGSIVLIGTGRTARYFTPEHARAAEPVEGAAA